MVSFILIGTIIALLLILLIEYLARPKEIDILNMDEAMEYCMKHQCNYCKYETYCEDCRLYHCSIFANWKGNRK